MYIYNRMFRYPAVGDKVQSYAYTAHSSAVLALSFSTDERYHLSPSLPPSLPLSFSHSLTLSLAHFRARARPPARYLCVCVSLSLYTCKINSSIYSTL